MKRKQITRETSTHRDKLIVMKTDKIACRGKENRKGRTSMVATLQHIFVSKF